MSLDSLITNGGKIVIIGGYAKAWNGFRDNPQLEFWSGEQKDIVRALKDKDIPANTKAVIISRFISHSELGQVMDTCRKRNIVMFPNKSDGEVSNLLDEITSKLPKPVKVIETPTSRGKLQPLLEFINFSKSNIENARALMLKAKELGIETTEQSLAQLVTMRRRKMGGTTVPNSVRNKLDVSVDMLDSMIQELSGMRDYLIEVTEENRILRTKLKKVTDIFAESKE